MPAVGAALRASNGWRIMRRFVLFSVMVLAVFVIPAPVSAAPPSSLFYTLVFADEFNGTEVDTSRWHYRTDVKRESAQRPENVTVGGGYLTIHQRKEPFAGQQYTGGGLISKKTFRYGYYETRARTSPGSGWHPAFWAMAGDGTTTAPESRRTEIDGFEFNMHEPSRIHHNAFGWRADGTRTTRNSVYGMGAESSADFHVYGFEWTEDEVKFYLDGALRFTADYTPTCCTEHDYIAVWLTSIAVDVEGIDDDALPGQVQFDYFRYYQSGNYTDNDGPTAFRYSETGAWTTSSLDGHTLGNPSRYSAEPGATATWGGWLPAAGTYEVYIYKIWHPNSDPNTRIDVTHNGGTSTQWLDYTTGAAGWVKLGTWSFGYGFNGSVKITGSGGGLARADAVKFVRVS